MINRIFFSLILLVSSVFAVNLSLQNVDVDSGTLDVYMENDVAVGGFQFGLTGIDITGASGGSAASNGFMVSTSATTVLGFSLTGGTIPSGEGTLLEVTFTGSPDEICLDGVVMSDPSGNALDTELGDCFGSDVSDDGGTDGGGVRRSGIAGAGQR